MKGRAFVLRWQRAVTDHLTEDRPTSQTTVLAVCAVVLAHADPDGTHSHPSRETMGRQTGLHHDVRRAFQAQPTRSVEVGQASTWLASTRYATALSAETQS